jgi:hypothetical protein
MMANVRARLLKIPAEPSPELRISGAAAQTRVISMAGIRLAAWESARAFKGIICDDVSEFESHMPSHAVGLSQVRSPRNRHAQSGARLWYLPPPKSRAASRASQCGDFLDMSDGRPTTSSFGHQIEHVIVIVSHRRERQILI